MSFNPLSSSANATAPQAVAKINPTDPASGNRALDSLKTARNTINQIAKKFDINVKLDQKTSFNAASIKVGILSDKLAQMIGQSEKTLASVYANRQKLAGQLELNKKLMADLNHIDAADVRLKGDKIVPCHTGIAHLAKAAFSSKYQKTLSTTRERFNTTKSAKIRGGIDLSDASVVTQLANLSAKEADVVVRMSDMRDSLDQVAGAAHFLAGRQHEVNQENDRARVKEANAMAGKKTANAFTPAHEKAFAEIYSTNAGFTAINNALRNNREPAVNSSSVIGELKRRHGDDIFAKGAKNEQYAIEDVAGRSLGQIRNYLSASYGEKVRGAAGKSAYQQLHRGQGITPGALKSLEALKANGVLISPAGLFSSSMNQDVARTFARPGSNEVALLIDIKGKTGIAMGSSNAVQSEREVVFTPDSRFEIVSLAKNASGHLLTLRELMPSEYQGKTSQGMPY